MKTITTLLSIMFWMTSAQAQKVTSETVPTAIKAALEKQYPAIKKVKWEKEHGNYEAEFELNETDYSVLIDVSGHIVETEVEIPTENLPAKAKEYITAHYPKQIIKEAAKITQANGEVNYEAEIKGLDVLFDATGNFIKENKE